MLFIKGMVNSSTKRKFSKIISLVSCAALASLMPDASSSAQEAAAAPVLVKPVPLQQEGLVIPGMGNEGLIGTRYTVKADGTTADVEILGGFTNPLYETTIRDNIAKWTFTPGSVNGDPQDFFNQRHDFRIQVAAELGVSEDVQKQLEPIQQLLEAKDFKGASAAIERALASNVHSLLDYGLMNQMMASAQMGLEDPFSALEYMKKATAHTRNPKGNKEYIVTPAILQTSLRQQLLIAATLRAQHEVLQAWSALDEIADIPADDSLREWVGIAEQEIAAPQLLALGKITDEAWLHVPTHRIFTVSDVREGNLDRIVAHCDRRTLELDYQEGVDWNLPASFGACQLEFEGKDGTLFSIYEFPQ